MGFDGNDISKKNIIDIAKLISPKPSAEFVSKGLLSNSLVLIVYLVSNSNSFGLNPFQNLYWELLGWISYEKLVDKNGVETVIYKWGPRAHAVINPLVIFYYMGKWAEKDKRIFLFIFILLLNQHVKWINTVMK